MHDALPSFSRSGKARLVCFYLCSKRGEEADAKRDIPGYRARRWVVERTHSWINRFRRLLIRWEKKAENYLGMLELACAYIAFRAAEVFGSALKANSI